MADPKPPSSDASGGNGSGGDSGPSQTLAELQSELSTLNRVSHRLAMTDAGPSLEKVLHVLLPRLLLRIGKNDDAKKANRRSHINKRKSPSPTGGAAGGASPKFAADAVEGSEAVYNQIDQRHETIHKKLIEMIGHTMKRVREDRECKLPCLAILELLLPANGSDITANAFTINLGLAFLTLGINRCTPAACAALLPGLLKFLGCNFDTSNNGNEIGVGYLIDPSRKMRHDQTWHLILRALETISHNPLEHAASRRAAQKSASSVSNSSKSSGGAESSMVSLHEAKEVLASSPLLAAALFDLFTDVFLYHPMAATSTLIPSGLSTAGYHRLIGGAASENSSGCKNWKEEFMTRGSLKQLKLKLLDLIAPCRRYALFLPEKSKTSDTGSGGQEHAESIADSGMGSSRTVALMVLLTGDVDPDVKDKAESYLRAHMDTYRGKEAPQTNISSNENDEAEGTAATSVQDALLGNSVALAQTMLLLTIGGAASLSIDKALSSQYTNATAMGILKSRLGLAYWADSGNAAWQKAFLSVSRMKTSALTSTAALKFVAKILDDNPKLFHVGMDMELPESDIAAASIGTLVLAVLGDLRRPGSSASQAMESASTLLNSLCVRLSQFYDARAQSGLNVSESLERIRLLLARSMSQACAVLAPTSTGESTSLGSSGTKASNIQIEIRDKCYGVMCTLPRSQFALDDRYSLFDCGKSSERASASFPLTSISTATLLFGCASNEAEMLRPRATSALDALLGAYVRVVKLLVEKEEKLRELEEKPITSEPANPWASPSELSAEDKKSKNDVSTEGLSRSLLPLLWSASRRNQPKSSRLAAARWCSELLLRLDNANACHLLCFLSGDEDATVSMIAKQALGVAKTLGEDNILTPDLPSSSEHDDIGTSGRASFSDLMKVIIGSQSSKRPSYSDFHVRAQAATLRFLLQSVFSEENFYGDANGGLGVTDFVQTILKSLAYYKGRSLTREETDLLDECSIALASCTSTSNDARLVLVNHDGESPGPCFGHTDIAALALSSNSSKTRRHCAEVVGHLYEDHLLWGESPTNPTSLSAWIQTTTLGATAKSCCERLGTMFEGSFAVGEVHGAAYLGSSCVRAFRLAVAGDMSKGEEHSSISECWESCCRIVSLLGKGLAHSDVAIGNAVSNGIVVAFSYDGQDAPVLHQRLFDAMAIALDEMNTALKKVSSIDHADPTRATALIQAAGLLLAASTSGAGFTKDAASDTNVKSTIDLGPARLQCTEALFAVLGSAVYRKDDEVSLAVGESLVKYADALGSGDWSTGSSAEFEEGPYDEKVAFELPPHKHVLYTMFKREIASSSPMKRNSCAATLLALIGHASRMANIDPSIVQRDFIQECAEHLSLFQSSFIKLLSDPKSKHLSRESACKGLAACRGLAAVVSSSMEDQDASQSQLESLNEQLLKAFGQTTNYGGSMMQETDAQARERRNDNEGNGDPNEPETQVGGAAGISEAQLGAYREMASAAMSLGQVDVLYSLMILSTNHPIWLMSDKRDRYSSKALLGKTEGTSVEEIRISLRPHLGKLIPKLLRACNDPNKQTREQMNNLWLALSGGGAESRALVTQNLLTTIDVLIQDAGNKLWRARVGACGALADIIVGRSWQDLGGGGIELDDEGSATKPTASIRLLRLWRITMRALDDVRTAVREQGEALGRGIRALTIRLCDPTVSDISQESDVYLSNAQRRKREKQSQICAEYAATVSLGWLIAKGLNQNCAEATGICISCLLGIVDVAKPSTLQPVLPELIGSLLMAMSGLEPSALNYLQVRAAGNDTNSQGNSGADRYDRLERLRINLAQSGPIAEALHKCLEMVKFVDLSAQKKLIPELDASLRKGAGFATRAATADAVGSLAAACPAAFSFPGSSMSNPTVRLLRALYFASERERGATAKDKMTHALGSLAELAPGKAVRILALKACERYIESSGSHNDPSVRKAAAATIRTICVRANSHLQDGGPKDIWCRIVLPTAYIGRHDKDEKVASLWRDVWDEGGTSAVNSSEQDAMFGVLLEEKLLSYIVKATAAALRSTSWANRKAGCAVLVELTSANILAPSPRSIDDSNKCSGEELDRLRQRARASAILLSECVKIIARARIWDGKGDVVKAGASIAGRWSASAPINGKCTEFASNCNWPLVLQNNSQDDLFSGDGWFKHQPILSEENEEVVSDDGGTAQNEPGAPDPEEDTALDLSVDDDEQMNENSDNVESDVEDNVAAQTLVFSGFCKVLLEQALRKASNNSTEGVLPYKASALSGLSALLNSAIPSKDSQEYNDMIQHQQFIYDLIAPNLFSFTAESQTSKETPVPPLLIARALECMAAAMYDGVGADVGGLEYNDAAKLLKFFALSSGPKQPAWTVRQMSALAASSLVSKMPSELLRKNEVITTVLECSTQTLKDKKFWKVRLSGLEVLLSLVSRVGSQKASAGDPEKQLVMEAILPYKEKIVELARKSLADNQSQVTATASKITLSMSWWP